VIEPSELSKRIDEDLALASSKKYLMLTSLVLLALLFSGAKVTEANTFLFKLTFTNSAGITNLLLLSIGFLLIRYYSNTSKYHKAIYDDWTQRALKQPYFFSVCEHSDGQSGYIVDIAPEYAIFNDPTSGYEEHDKLNWTLHVNLYLNAQIQYDLYNQHGHIQDKKVYIFQYLHPIKSCKAIWIIFKHWIEAQTRFRESLDIYAPYMIAFFTTICAVSTKLMV
jgi:hypothetical protein